MVDIDGDGTHDPIDPELKPQPVQGDLQFLHDVCRTIRYPASAREKGIGGTVIVQISVDELGHVLNTSIVQSVSPDIDKESLRSLKYALRNGYQPLMIDEKAYPFKVTVPVKFRIE